MVVFTGKEVSPEEDVRLHTLDRSVEVTGVDSPERLLDETALFWHRVVAHLPPETQQMLNWLHCSQLVGVGHAGLGATEGHGIQRGMRCTSTTRSTS
jgi:hypothetical protein